MEKNGTPTVPSGGGGSDAAASNAASPAATSNNDAPPQAGPSTTAGDDDPPLSKNQLKKRRRWERAQANKRRRKDQERELRRMKAEKDGRNLEEERRQQRQNEKDGKGWKKREEKWQQIMQKADIANAFRVCFDCAFEDEMTWKENNSLSLQLRYTYAVNRKSAMPVYIDVCGMKRGGVTWEGLEKVEGFPDKWVGRAFHCYQGKLEEVYSSVGAGNGGADVGNEAGEKGDAKSEQGSEKRGSENDASNDATKDAAGPVEQPYPKLSPNHQFVYLTGDSPNTLTTLDNNTTYIIGGIVDRNRLKRAAINRADSINAMVPSLSIKTARLPLDENCDFKASTRILTCNHVFEILQKYRENGYKDWRGAIMAVLPERKDVEERANKAGADAAQNEEGGLPQDK